MKRLVCLCTIALSIGLSIVAAGSSSGAVYFAAAGSIRSVEVDGTGLRTLVDRTTSGMYGAPGLAVDPIGGQVYFGGEGGPNTYRIARANLDGTAFQPLIEGRPVLDMEVDGNGGKLYIAFGGKQFFRANLDGSGFETIDFSFLGNVDVRGLALDTRAGKLYFAEHVSGSIYRSSLDGSGVEQVLQLGAGTTLSEVEIDPVAGMLYWNNTRQNKMQRGTIDGTFIEDVVVGIPGMGAFNRGLALDIPSQTAYWSTPGSPFGPGNPGGIFRVGFDGTGVSQVLASDEDIQGIDIGPSVSDAPVIPEPCALVVWSLLGASGAGLGCWRRRRQGA